MDDNPYLDLIAKPSAPEESRPPVNPYVGLLSEEGQDRGRQAGAILNAADRDPGARARALSLAKDTGLPPDTVERNQPMVEREAKMKRLRAALDDAPALAKLMEEDHEFLTLAQDDTVLFKSAGVWDKLKAEYRAGVATNQLGFLGSEAMGQGLTDERRARIDLLRGVIGNADKAETDNWFMDKMAGPAARMVGQQVEGLPRRGTAALAGAGTAIAVGQMGPQVALPEEIITAPAAAIAGFAAQSAAESGFIEQGMAWLELNDIRGKNGEALDPEVRNGAAAAVGLINGSLEMVGMASVAKPVLDAGKKLFAKGVAEYAATAAGESALKVFAKGYAGAVVGETTTEVLQEVSNIAAEELAKMASDGTFERMADSPEERAKAVDRVLAIAAQTAGGMALLGVPGATVSAASTKLDQKRQGQEKPDQRDPAAVAAEVNAANLDAAVELAQSSPTLARSKERFEAAVAALTDEAEVHIAAEPLQRLFQSLEVGEASALAEDLGIFDPFMEAQTTGGDIAIPVAKYVTALAPYHQQLRADVRLDPNGRTLSELEEANAESRAALEQAAEEEAAFAEAEKAATEPAQKVGDDVRAQLRATGRYGKDAIDQMAALMEAFFGRTYGDKAFEQYQRWGVAMVGEMPQAIAGREVDQMDFLIDRVRSGKQPTSEVGDSLLTFIAKRGGVEDSGGELKARDLDRWQKGKSFRKKLVRESADRSPTLPGVGRAERGNFSLEEVARAAADSGYLPDLKRIMEDPEAPAPDFINTLLEAIDRELGGTPVYAEAAIDPQTEAERRAIEELARLLDQMGIDLADPETTNQMVKDALAALSSEQAGEGALYQGGQINTESKAFARWFADSKVVDADGKPLVVYHGTGADIEAFDPNSRGRESGLRDAQEGFYFAANADMASTYAEAARQVKAERGPLPPRPSVLTASQEELETWNRAASAAEDQARLTAPGQSVYPVYLSINNPLVVDGWRGSEASAAIMQRAKADGHDGVQFRGAMDGGTIGDVWVAFRPEQIKSVFNRGSFDPNDPRILASEQRAFSPAVIRDLDKLQSRLDARLKTVGLSDAVSARVARELSAAKTGKAGTYLSRIIRVAYDARDPGWTMDHEIVHALRDVGVIRELEWKTLAKAARADAERMVDIRDRYKGLDADALTEEAIADMFADWVAGRTQVGGPLERAFERIKAFFNAILDAFTGMGYRSVDDIFTAMDTGALANRSTAPARRMMEAAQAAWHGSPHDFDRFDLSKIGTGEGSQAFGYGLYFAGKKGIAEWYKRKLSPVEDGETDRAIAFIGDKTGMSNVREEWAYSDERDYVTLAADQFGFEPRYKQGRLYKVEIPDDGEYLLWDKPLSEQPEGVKKALIENMDKFDSPSASHWLKQLMADETPSDLKRHGFETTGAQMYQHLAADDGQKAASMALLDAKIPGIKYLDGTSRGAGDGSFNYVVFDEKLVSISEFEQRADNTTRGSIEFGEKTIIRLFQSADLSTALHEFGHLFLRVMQRAVAEGDGPATLAADYQTIKAWLGKVDDGAFTVEQEEQWARGFEAYLREGKSPSLALQSAFSRFKAWLMSIYKSLTALRVEITPEIRGVMDRMLASEDEIAAAEAAMRYRSPFKDAKQAGMTEEQFAAYTEKAARASEAAKADILKQLLAEESRAREAWWKDERAKVRSEVEAEVNRRPVYAASLFLTNGEWSLPGEPPMPMKLDRAALVSMHGEEMLKYLPRSKGWAYAKEGGVHPDIVAPLFGYPSGDAMLQEMLQAPKRDEVIEAETDARMFERHGDMLNDGTAQEAALEASHNDDRGLVLLAELKAMRSASVQGERAARAEERYVAREVVRSVEASPETYRQIARTILGRKLVKDATSPVTYQRAEVRAAAATEKAIAKGDYIEAARQKERQILNFYLWSEARKAAQEVEKAQGVFARFNKPDEKLTKSLDVDYLYAIRWVLARYGIGRPDPKFDFGTWRNNLQAEDPDAFDRIALAVDAASGTARPWKQLILDEFRGLADAVDNLRTVGRSTRKIELDGQKVDLDTAIADLTNQAAPSMRDRAGGDRGLTPKERTGLKFLGALASLSRVEAWARMMDGGTMGAFTRIMVRPVMGAVAKYRDAKADTLGKLLAILEPRKAELMSSGSIAAPEIGYTFTNKGELLAAILHTGNESNMERLLLARRRNASAWGKVRPDGSLDTAKWSALIARLASEGRLTKDDFDTAQAIWDLLETTKPAAQKAHREMYGYYFSEITVRPVQTPFGTYRGGYVPAIVDRDLTSDGARRNAQDALSEQGTAAMFPSTGRGFTKSRVQNYHQPLDLNLLLLPSHIDKVLRFTHLNPTIRGLGRIAINRDFVATMENASPHALDSMILPWLNRVGRQTVEAPSLTTGGQFFSGIARFVRKATGLQIMAGNLLNALQQITGLFPAATRVPPAALMRALVAFRKNPETTRAGISEKSAFMRQRMDNSANELIGNIDEVLSEPGLLNDMQRFGMRHGYILQQIMQNYVDVVVWRASYEQAVKRGASDADAGYEADSVVRTTQGSLAPEDISNFEAGPAWARLFTMFVSYFNTQANMLFSEGRTALMADDKHRLFALYFFGVFAPAVAADMIVRTFKGEWDDEDDGLGDDLAETFGLAQARYMVAMIPGAGPFLTAGLNKAFTGKVFDDHVSISPIVSTAERAMDAPGAVYKAIAADGKPSRAIKDTAVLIGLSLGLPLGQPARPIGYVADVATGNND